MKKYLSQLGYKYTKKDDLGNKEFRLISTNLQNDEELSTLGNIRHIASSDWELSLTKYDVSLLDKKLIELYNLCSNMNCKDAFDSDYDNGKTYYLDSYLIEDNQEENRNVLTITFIIKGK
jgi:hypothetical protein